MHNGIMRTGESTILPLSTKILLSPPIPYVLTSAARTRVLWPPTTEPLSTVRTNPPRIIPRSVVVPPISAMSASLTPVWTIALVRLEAGPDIMVSMGLFMAVFTFIMEPSPLTIIIGAWIPRSSSAFLTESIRSMIVGMSPALMIAVFALLSNPSLDVSSWAHTTGIPSIFSAIVLTASS